MKQDLETAEKRLAEAEEKSEKIKAEARKKVKNEKQLNKVIDKIEDEIKETIIELKKDPEIYEELQKEIKKDFDDSQIIIEKRENKLESYTKNKVDSKVSSLSKTADPKSKAKEMALILILSVFLVFGSDVFADEDPKLLQEDRRLLQASR